MKSTIKSFICIAIILMMTACDKDGDKIYLSGLNSGELMVSQSNILLTQEKSNDIVLSVAWNIDDLQVSDESMSAPDIVTKTLQISTSSDFSGGVTESVESSDSRAFTGSELNSVAKNIGAVPDTENTLYFRIKATTGNNMDPVYTNVGEVIVTPFSIDMSVGFVLDSKQAATTSILYSKNSDGDYVGFMGATGWFNWYLKEGDGTVWGNDGVAGTPFLISSESTRWNFWFPGLGGCYYVNLNTTKKVWSALYMPLLSIKGDINGDMQFDRPNLKWIYTFNASQAGEITVNISGNGKQYDYSTGTDDAAAKNATVGFIADGEKVAFSNSSSDIKVNVPAAGECTLVLDLSDPRNMKLKVEAGSSKPAEVKKEIFLSGIDDAISGGWNFNNKLTLYDEDNKSYSGVVYAASQWGYKIYTEVDNWEDLYSFASGDANEGLLAYKGGNNLPAPAEGLYFFDVSLKGLSYKLFKIVDKIYYSGVNDDWTLHELTVTPTKGLFQGSVTITKASEWGFQLILDEGWSYKFGGSAGKIYYKGDNFKDDATLAPGTYTFTVNLINGTYTIE